MELEKALRLREAEIEILKECARKERAELIALREEEVAEYQEKLESVKQELEEEREKIPPLKEEIQQLLVELARKSEEIRHLRNSWEETNSQLKMEREIVEMKTKEITAAAVSKAEYMKEVQIQLALLQRSKKEKKKIIHNLQETLQRKEDGIKALSQQISAKEGQKNLQTYAEESAELKLKERISKELTDMKMNIIRLQDEVSHLRTAVKLSQKEASCYQEHATFISTATNLILKWSDRRKSPEPMQRGVAVVHGTIAYIIGRGSHTIYSYRLDGDKWNKHSECPHVNLGLVIINDLLTAVGGHPHANKLCTWKGTKWVETFSPMQTPHESPAVVHYGDYVIAVGGDCEERSVELLHVPSLLWSTATSLPSSLSGITTTLCNDCIIAMDYEGFACMINVNSLLTAAVSLKGSTDHPQWMSFPSSPLGWTGPTLSFLSGLPCHRLGLWYAMDIHT